MAPLLALALMVAPPPASDAQPLQIPSSGPLTAGGKPTSVRADFFSGLLLPGDNQIDIEWRRITRAGMSVVTMGPAIGLHAAFAPALVARFTQQGLMVLHKAFSAEALLQRLLSRRPAVCARCIDTNGVWGAAERSSCERVSFAGGQLSYVGEPAVCVGDTTTTLTKAENDPNGVVGVWAFGSPTLIKTQTFVFYGNGKFMMLDP